jgi:hypothetical protein
MPLFDAETLDALSEALGQTSFTIGEATVTGYLAKTDQPVLPGDGAPQLAEHLVGRVRTGSLPGLVVGASITVVNSRVGTLNCTVRELRQIPDGARTEIFLGLS